MTADPTISTSALGPALAALTPQIIAAAEGSPALYAALRGLLVAARAEADLPLDLHLALRDHCEQHCRHCGASLRVALGGPRLPWCPACRDTGRPAVAPAWSVEDWPDCGERAACQDGLARARACWAAGERREAQGLLEELYRRAERHRAFRELVEISDALLPAFAACNDHHYVLKLLRRQRRWAADLGDATRLLELEGSIGRLEALLGQEVPNGVM